MEKPLIDRMVLAAVRAATTSGCQKSQRGVVIFNRSTGHLVSLGTNAPTAPFRCDGSLACRASCGKICIHAEMDALLGAQINKSDLRGCDMLHVKVEKGAAVSSGPPSCWQCSRHIHASDLDGMWLLHAEGLRRYSTLEFQELTLNYHGLFAGVSAGEAVSGT